MLGLFLALVFSVAQLGDCASSYTAVEWKIGESHSLTNLSTCAVITFRVSCVQKIPLPYLWESGWAEDWERIFGYTVFCFFRFESASSSSTATLERERDLPLLGKELIISLTRPEGCAFTIAFLLFFLAAPAGSVLRFSTIRNFSVLILYTSNHADLLQANADGHQAGG